jgi:hypothetical protein
VSSAVGWDACCSAEGVPSALCYTYCALDRASSKAAAAQLVCARQPLSKYHMLCTLRRPDSILAVARMPALEQLALPPADAFKEPSAAAEVRDAALHGNSGSYLRSGAAVVPSNLRCAQLRQHMRSASWPHALAITTFKLTDSLPGRCRYNQAPLTAASAAAATRMTR